MGSKKYVPTASASLFLLKLPSIAFYSIDSTLLVPYSHISASSLLKPKPFRLCRKYSNLSLFSRFCCHHTLLAFFALIDNLHLGYIYTAILCSKKRSRILQKGVSGETSGPSNPRSKQRERGASLGKQCPGFLATIDTLRIGHTNFVRF